MTCHTHTKKAKCQSKSNAGTGSITSTNVVELRYPFEL